jgi:nicotinate phosphoribosyltransferase
MSEALLVDLYELTMAQVYFKCRREVCATFDLFIRSNKRPFYVACGVDEAIDYLENLRFLKEDINYLRSLGLFEDDFIDYLHNFRFKGQVWGVSEPQVVFAQEPILRVTGDIIETQIIESALLNKINLATTLATKATRVVLASKGRGVYDFSLRRTQGRAASLAAAKYSYMVGARGTSNVEAGFIYGIPVAGTMAHSFVMSFNREIESFIAFSRQFPAKSILLVDTYDVKKGIAQAVTVAKFLKKKGVNLLGIRLDSGDLVRDSKYARHTFDKEGLIDVMIFASGNLDEYKIEELMKKGAPIDAFGVGTNMGCSADQPFSDVIYKLVEIQEKGKRFIPTMKLSTNKTTMPSRKQLIRTFSSKGLMLKDNIVLENEKVKGKRLLKKLMNNGKRLYSKSSLEEKRAQFKKILKSFPASLKATSPKVKYPVMLGKNLKKLTDTLEDKMRSCLKPKVVFMDIDTQHDFLHPKGKLYVKGSRPIVNSIKKLTKFAQKQNILILSTQDTHSKSDPEFKEFPAHCIEGKHGHQKIKGTVLSSSKVIKPDKIYSMRQLTNMVLQYSHLILQKNILNAFSNLNLSILLEIIFPEAIYVYGVATDYCVREAVEGLLKMGFNVVLITDAVKEISSKEKVKLYKRWRRLGVKFKTSSLVTKGLSR